MLLICVVFGFISAQIPPFRCFCAQKLLVYYCKCRSTLLFHQLQNDSLPEVFHLPRRANEDVSQLDFSYQPIEELPKIMGIFNNLLVLTAEHSSLTSINLYCHPNLEEIKLSYNDISNINSTTFMLTKRIKYIDLSHNSFSTINFEKFHNLRNLEILDLAWNKISIVEELLPHHLPHLTHLNLSGNLIKTLASETFYPSSNLGDINLNHNQISKIEKDFINLSRVNRYLMLRLEKNICVDKTVKLTGNSTKLSDLAHECSDNFNKNRLSFY